MHNDIPLQRFAGARTALGVYGAPTLRVTKAGLVVAVIALVVLFALASGAIQLPHVAPLMLLAGPVRSVTLREEAVALLGQARDLADEDGNVPAEKLEQFNALWSQWEAKDKELQEAEKLEGKTSRLSERLAYYTGKVTGEAMRFSETLIDMSPSARKSPGQQFVESDAFKQAQQLAQSNVDTHFRSLPVTIMPRLGVRSRLQGAATDIVQTESGGPANALVLPYRLPGVSELAQRPLVVRQLFDNEDMPSGDTIQYAQQSGFDNAAAAVAQATTTNTNTLAGGLKPQSSIAYTLLSAPAEWIATYMVTTRQALSDASQIQALINNQGRLMIRLAEDDQLLNGNGTAPNISGVLDQTGLQTLNLTGEDNLDGIRTARRLAETGISRLPASFIVLNPIDSEEFDLLKDGNNNYRGGNPIGDFNFNNSIWRLQRAESEAIASGTALVGSRAGATVFEREPLRVLVADQHSDFFVRNLVVILFEERLAFPVYFPSAFVVVTLAAW